MINNQNQIPEEIQWQIFELLEGNLSETEAIKTKQLVDSKSDYQIFYHELSLTYLQPEPTDYPQKSILFKSSDSKLKVWRNLTIAISSAAAIAIFLLNKSETPHSISHSHPITKNQKTAFINQAPKSESTVHIIAPTLTNKLKKTTEKTIKNNSEVIPTAEVSPQIAITNVTNRKPFRVIPIIDENLPEITSHSGEINPNNNSINLDPEVQIVYTGFDQNNSEIPETSQTDFLLDIAENLRYGRLPKMKLVPRRRQNHLIPQVDMLVGTETRFIQTTLIQ